MRKSTVFARRVSAFAAVCCGVSLLAGCGSADPADAPANLKALAACYEHFARAHRGAAPAGEEEFRAFIESATDLPVQVSDVDDLLTSPRDGRPLRIMYGAASTVPGPGGMPLVAWEEAGVEGKRLVVWINGDVKELDETEFQKQTPGR